MLELEAELAEASARRRQTVARRWGPHNNMDYTLQTITRITSDCGATRSLGNKWPVITSGCVPCRAEQAQRTRRTHAAGPSPPAAGGGAAPANRPADRSPPPQRHEVLPSCPAKGHCFSEPESLLFVEVPLSFGAQQQPSSARRPAAEAAAGGSAGVAVSPSWDAAVHSWGGGRALRPYGARPAVVAAAAATGRSGGGGGGAGRRPGLTARHAVASHGGPGGRREWAKGDQVEERERRQKAFDVVDGSMVDVVDGRLVRSS